MPAVKACPVDAPAQEGLAAPTVNIYSYLSRFLRSTHAADLLSQAD